MCCSSLKRPLMPQRIGAAVYGPHNTFPPRQHLHLQNTGKLTLHPNAASFKAHSMVNRSVKAIFIYVSICRYVKSGSLCWSCSQTKQGQKEKRVTLIKTAPNGAKLGRCKDWCKVHLMWFTCTNLRRPHSQVMTTCQAVIIRHSCLTEWVRLCTRRSSEPPLPVESETSALILGIHCFSFLSPECRAAT